MNPAHAELSLAPLGAGELIDRAVVLYQVDRPLESGIRRLNG